MRVYHTDSIKRTAIMKGYIRSREAAGIFRHQLQIFIDLKDIHCSVST